MIKDMEMVILSINMTINMMDNGKMIWKMGKVNFVLEMVMYIQEILKITIWTDKVY